MAKRPHSPGRPSRRQPGAPAGRQLPARRDSAMRTPVRADSARQLRQYNRKRRAVRRELKRRVHGRPTHSTSMLTIPQVILQSIGRVLKVVLLLVLIVGFFLLGTGSGMLTGYLSTANELQLQDIRHINEPTRIYDALGNEIAVLTGSQNISREYVPISEVQHTYIEEAFIAIEDERFRTHPGIDPRRIASAVLSMLANAGSPTHGGSTITQQTVKMLSGQTDISAQRKIQEQYNAVRLEQRKSKDEIMELFLNLVPMSNNYVGIQAAAKAYFDKPASELNLAECAFLAGIPNRPATYNPLTENGKRNTLRRMRIILEKMLHLEMITEEEFQEAINEELIFRQRPPENTASQINSYFVDTVITDVINDLVRKRGYSPELAQIAVYTYGLTIETTMDPAVQKAAERAFKNEDLFIRDPSAIPDIPEKPQASITIIDNNPATAGQVRGIVGGYGQKLTNFVLNRATDSKRQPGSSIKPILVYAPAIDAGVVSAGSVLQDEPVYLDDQNPDVAWPLNANRTYSGPVTIREALVYSLNTISGLVYKNYLTPEAGLAYLKLEGIDRTDEPYVAGAVGGFSYGMSTFEMAGAYATLANNGIYTEPYLYTRVLDAEGNVLLEKEPVIRQVFKPETAWIVTDILKQAVLEAGWYGPSQLTYQVSAGKTGTTDYIVDSWFCGYTPYYTAAVWYGYDNHSGRRTEIPVTDRYNSQYIWSNVMEQIHENLEPRDFSMMGSVETLTICNATGMLAGSYCPSTHTEYFVPGAAANPSSFCTYHSAPPAPIVPATPIIESIVPTDSPDVEDPETPVEDVPEEPVDPVEEGSP